jgi:hypothetical protein
LGDSVGLGLGEATTGFGFGVTSTEKSEAGVGPGEFLAPLELGGSEVLGATLVASRV